MRSIPLLIFITLVVFIFSVIVFAGRAEASELIYKPPGASENGDAGLCYDRDVWQMMYWDDSYKVDYFTFTASNESAELYGYNLWYDEYTIVILDESDMTVIDAFSWTPTATGTQIITGPFDMPMGTTSIHWTVGSTASSCPSTATTIGADTSGVPDWQDMYYNTTRWPTYDIVVKFYGTTTYASADPATLSDWATKYRNAPYPDFQTSISHVCFINEDCNIWVFYNELMVGEELRLIDASDDSIVDTEVINSYVSGEKALVWPAETSEQTDTFNLFSPVCYEYIVDGADLGGCGIRKSGYEIAWVASSTWLPDFSVFDDPCFTVATSSGSMADDFRYGVECGFRKFTAWLLEPDESVWLRIDHENAIIKNDFPLNVWNNINNTFTATSATTTLKLFPLLDNTASTMAYMIDQELIEADTHFSIVATLRQFLNILIWIGLFWYFTMRFFTFTNKELPDND